MSKEDDKTRRLFKEYFCKWTFRSIIEVEINVSCLKEGDGNTEIFLKNGNANKRSLMS